MERLTIPDILIEGGTRRAIIDARAVRGEAMTIYWRLKKYEDICSDPERLKEVDKLYLEKCQEVSALQARMRWIPVYERLPKPHTDVLVAVVDFVEDEPSVYIDCLVENNDRLTWGTYNGAQEKVLAWMPLPEPYRPEKLGFPKGV